VAVVCSKCGFENSEQARFCGGCAAPLETVAAAREMRKTVTVVFCDVTGSTALGERLDPESLRRVMARYFDAMRDVIERHGGTVEKFIGDAVMAVFGIPQVHEDDGLRAVRAAAGMRAALAELNEELERDYGTRLEARIGINTGEVVTGTEERLATGDAVNVAARLEQAAAPGEILLGRETYRLVRDVVEAEELPPLELKGKAGGVSAYRLLSVSGETPARRHDRPMVGRERELRLLRDAWERAVSERSCVLFTLLGVAGVGKSRLTEEFLAGVDALVVRGRCLSYGEGITYWPAVEVVLQLQGAGFEPIGPVAGLIGEAAATSPDEIAWGVRKLLEQAAAERPLVVVLDDIQWAEPAFLDLVEHTATMSRGAPILLFCVARPDVLDRRPNWGGGLLNATTVLLEPLSADETDELIRTIGGGLDAGLAARIRAAAEGNPLFVEEMVAMVEEAGAEEIIVPPTVHALLAARLDQLDPAERGVLERGSVEGQVFHRGAVQALAPEEPEVAPRLVGLVRKELVRPEATTFAGDEAYRFRHILIRDAAYDALPKATRARLHERFAAWLDERGDLVEQDEIVGYHLEQAYRYRVDLGPVDDAGREVARRAAERLAAGGRVALYRRGDVRGSVSLLGRAVELLPGPDPLRLRLLSEFAKALAESGDFESAQAAIDDALTRAAEAGDDVAAAHARIEAITLTTNVGGQSDRIRPAFEELEQIIELLEQREDGGGLARAWAVLGRLRFYAGEAAAEPAYERAIELARREGMHGEVRDWRGWWLASKRYGPTPVEEALACGEDVIAERAAVGMPVANAQFHTAGLLAMRGDLDAARELLELARSTADQFGVLGRMMVGMEGAEIFLLAGDPAAALDVVRGSYDLGGQLGEMGWRATAGGYLAEALLHAGRLDEAETIAAEVEQFASPDDFEPHSRLRWVRASILAERGELVEAEELAREAVAIVEETDWFDQRGCAHRVLGDVLAAAGRLDEAADEWRTALDLFERKGNVVRSEQVRELLGG